MSGNLICEYVNLNLKLIKLEFMFNLGPCRMITWVQCTSNPVLASTDP
jgi:hypothetical protein